MTNRRIIRRAEVEVMTGLSHSTIYRRLRANDFPRPLRLGENSVGWYEDEIERWLESKRLPPVVTG